MTNSAARHLSFVNPEQGVLEQVEVGAAPWGLALAPDGRAYVTTAEGVAVVDMHTRQRLALVTYERPVGPAQFGEYRPGGMGIAAAPDGRRVYVAVYRSGEPSRLEILDTTSLTLTGSVEVGARPFQVLVSADGREVYTIDHDGYSVTVVDPATGQTRNLTVAPLGRGAFDKPHYAALGAGGRLLLPVQGRVLVTLDPATGEATTSPLTATTHQHGVAMTPTGAHLLIVGAGPAGGAGGGPSLTVVEMTTLTEHILPLTRPHEQIMVSPDGRHAYLTGGYPLGGWDGLTVIDLVARTTREIAVPDRPLDIIVLP